MRFGERFSLLILGYVLAFGVNVLGPSKVMAEDSKTQGTPSGSVESRSTIWTMGLQGNRHALKGGDGNELIGNSFTISIGRGHVAPRWFARGSVDVISGPYERVRGGQFDSDFSGTGLGAWWGYSAQPADLRDKEGGYGFAVGLSYSDFSGHSIGQNRLEGQAKDETVRLIDSYSLRATDMSIIPALFFSWLKEARPEGDSPELLKTRIEGYLLTLGIAMPVLGYYNANVEYRNSANDESQSEKLESGDEKSQGEGGKVTEKGDFQGYSILLNFTTFFGV